MTIANLEVPLVDDGYAAGAVDVEPAEAAIRQAKERADRVVVAVHWGVPWCYLPSNQGRLAQYQQPLGRRLVDAGADVVVGTHPHCMHPSAVFEVELGGSRPRLRLHPIETYSQEIDPGVRMSSDGTVDF